MPPGFRPLVVDNGSSDGSAEIALRLGARVVREPQTGFGAACHAGLLAAHSELVCFMDCDGSLDPRELPRVAGPVLGGERELMLGARQAERGAWRRPAGGWARSRSATAAGPAVRRSPARCAGLRARPPTWLGRCVERLAAGRARRRRG